MYNSKGNDLVGMVQLVKTPGCGPGGREFESHYSPHAGLAELADALDLGSSENFSWRFNSFIPHQRFKADVGISAFAFFIVGNMWVIGFLKGVLLNFL